MKKTIFRYVNLIIVVALFLCCVVSSYVFSKAAFNNNVKSMLYSLHLVDYAIDYHQDLKTQIAIINDRTLGNDSRITMIDLEGNVVADSAVNEIEENHADRQEIQDTLKNGVGHEVRYSSTVKTNMLYVAFLSDQGYILRLAVPFNGAWDYVKLSLPAITLGIVISLSLSLIFSKLMAKKISEPLENISHQLLSMKVHKPQFEKDIYEYDELNDIAMVTDKLANRINQTEASLKRQKNKVHYILDFMQEGMMIIDEKYHVLLINQAINHIFNCQDIEKGSLIECYINDQAIVDLIKSKNEIEAFSFNERHYSLHKAKIDSGVYKNGTILLFLDDTEQVQAMRMKQQFFANASHELKTPLTSIQGYTELLNQNLIVDEKQKQQFLDRILKETRNMTKLITDILTISKLESQQNSVNFEPIHLKLMIEDIFHTLTPLANDKKISLINHSEDIDFYGDLEQINQLLMNLLSNSIKYGKTGGWVSLKITPRHSGINIIVEDNGIGIVSDDLAHVTERFYRCDKGRTKKVEGTGLGLAIVKHITQMYDGYLRIESELGEGTKVTIYLKNKKKDVA